MLRLLLMVNFCLFCFASLSQKPILDTNAVLKWPKLYSEKISNDGKIVIFSVVADNKSLLCIRLSDGTTVREFSGGENSIITEDDEIIFKLPNDTCCIFQPYLNKAEYLLNVDKFEIAEGGKSSRLFYTKKGEHELFIYNLTTGIKKSYSNNEYYRVNSSGSILALFLKDDKNSSEKKLYWINLDEDVSRVIWRGNKISDLVFNGEKIAFLGYTNSSKTNENMSLYYFAPLMDYAKVCFNNSSAVDSGVAIKQNTIQFNDNGDRLFFKVSRRPLSKKEFVHIWSYQDEMLRYLKDAEDQTNMNRSYLSYYTLGSDSFHQLEYPEDGTLFPMKVGKGGNGRYALSCRSSNIDESYLKISARPTIILSDLQKGGRVCIKDNVFLSGLSISPGEKYVIWYDRLEKNYFVYDIQKGRVRNISKNITTRIYDELWDVANAPLPYGIAKWFAEDSAFLLYDRYDIWKVDPQGKKRPENVTNGFGRRSKIILRCREQEQGEPGFLFHGIVISNVYRELLCAFDERTKQNGFFELRYSSKSDPLKLIMSSDFYYFNENESAVTLPTYSFFKKARLSNTFLIKKMNTMNFPNLMVTTDFKTFIPISNIDIEKHYNWITSELIRWKVRPNVYSQGILYKPENFDSTRKYPVIVYMYERLSAGINLYQTPGLCGGPINIPLFVSRGYMVFCPDIRYKIGEPGQSAFDYVVSGVECLKKNKWVNSNKIGLQGHSWGAFEVNWLIANTHMFRAAVSASGLSDFNSLSYTSFVNMRDPHTFVEMAQCRMGKTVWEIPKLYIKNSPLFSADKINTPLLMMHCKNDNAVPWEQAFALFTSLRKLHRKVWLLQYEEGGSGHVLFTHENINDYTRRLLDFWGYYLMDLKQPDWMISFIK